MNRIRRDIVASEKFVADQRKLMNEADRLCMDRWLATVIALGGLLVGALDLSVALARHWQKLKKEVF